MKVVEKDKVISGMLHDELKRCQELLERLEKSVSRLPKGVLSQRKKRYKEKVYSYHYLKYRDGEKVINKHIPDKEIQGVKNNLEMRKKYLKEMQSYKNRINYLNKIISSGKRRGNAD